jgi:peptide/nickel transport system permease protein
MGRFGFVGRRLLQSAPVALAVLLATFLLLKLVPGDPARAVAGPRATDAAVAVVREDLGLDEPVWAQFGRYLERVATGDLGSSAVSRVPVSRIVGENAPVTIWLVIGGASMSVVLAVPAALAAASFRGRVVDRVIRAGTMVGLTVPPFWIGLLLLEFAAVRTGWFPVGGWPGPWWQRLRTITLPSFTLGLAVAPLLVRSLRAAMVQVLAADHVVAARAAGVSGLRLVRFFVLRNSLVPTVALLATTVGYLLFGAVLVESVFGLPGLGQTMVQAAISRDFNVVQGLTLVFALSTVAANLLGDIVLAGLDPRIRVGR